LSEALIFESFNPKYDEGLFIESPEKYKFRTCCAHCANIVLNVKTKKQFLYTTCSKLVFFEGNSMNNLLSYCGLTDARLRASDRDLPVQV